MNETVPTHVEIGDSVIYQDLQDEVVILNLASQQYYGLDDVGAAMWKPLLDRREVASATRQLATEFDVDSDVVRADLYALIRQLMESGLLKSSPLQI